MPVDAHQGGVSGEASAYAPIQSFGGGWFAPGTEPALAPPFLVTYTPPRLVKIAVFESVGATAKPLAGPADAQPRSRSIHPGLTFRIDVPPRGCGAGVV